MDRDVPDTTLGAAGGWIDLWLCSTAWCSGVLQSNTCLYWAACGETRRKTLAVCTPCLERKSTQTPFQTLGLSLRASIKSLSAGWLLQLQ
jgi:hypothetical protein